MLIKTTVYSVSFEKRRKRTRNIDENRGSNWKMELSCLFWGSSGMYYGVLCLAFWMFLRIMIMVQHLLNCVYTYIYMHHYTYTAYIVSIVTENSWTCDVLLQVGARSLQMVGTSEQNRKIHIEGWYFWIFPNERLLISWTPFYPVGKMSVLLILLANTFTW